MGNLAIGFVILCLFVVMVPVSLHFAGIDAKNMFGTYQPPTYDEYLQKSQRDGIYQS